MTQLQEIETQNHLQQLKGDIIALHQAGFPQDFSFGDRCIIEPLVPAGQNVELSIGLACQVHEIPIETGEMVHLIQAFDPNSPGHDGFDGKPEWSMTLCRQFGHPWPLPESDPRSRMAGRVAYRIPNRMDLLAFVRHTLSAETSVTNSGIRIGWGGGSRIEIPADPIGAVQSIAQMIRPQPEIENPFVVKKEPTMLERLREELRRGRPLGWPPDQPTRHENEIVGVFMTEQTRSHCSLDTKISALWERFINWSKQNEIPYLTFRVFERVMSVWGTIHDGRLLDRALIESPSGDATDGGSDATCTDGPEDASPGNLEETNSDTTESIRQFIEETCVTGDCHCVNAGELHEHYVRFCDATRTEPVSKRSFGLILRRLGFKSVRSGWGRGWAGVGIREVA